MSKKLGVGLIGAGFSARFHVKSWVGVRNADIVAIYSRTEKRAKELAHLAEQLGVGKPKTYTDIHELVRDPNVDAVWILIPNFMRVEVVKAIVEEVEQGKSNVKAVACEKPLARTVAEAKEMIKLVEKAGLDVKKVYGRSFVTKLFSENHVVVAEKTS